MKKRMLVLFIDTPIEDKLAEKLLEVMRHVAGTVVSEEYVRTEEWDR